MHRECHIQRQKLEHTCEILRIVDSLMVRQHHQLNGYEFEQTPGNSAG